MEGKVNTNRTWRQVVLSDLGILILLGLALFILHMLTNGNYGFHRDELQVLDDARYPAWGYVTYPPFTPLITRLSLELFGTSPVGLRLFAALTQSVIVVVAGLMAHELGGSRLAQIVSAAAVAITPVVLVQGSVFMYVSFDYLWWVLIAYFTIRLLKSEDPRWWLGIGGAIGLGMMTKYTMAFFVVGVVGAVILTKLRRYLASPWLWAGVALSLLIFLPNLIWQVQHDFISLEFLGSIHERDIGQGRTEGFVLGQFLTNMNPLVIPLWAAGLYFCFLKSDGRPYRVLGWMYVIPLVLFLVTQGRDYYLAPAYPMLIAAGAVVWDGWRASLAGWKRRAVMGATWGALVTGSVLAGVLTLPIAPINSDLWRMADDVHELYREQVGWVELVEAIDDIYEDLPETERAQTGILAGNYGEAGAIYLYGPDYELPPAISSINTYWLRGYGSQPPETLIVVGFNHQDASYFFGKCELAAPVTNRYGIENEESSKYPGIFLCRGPRRSWPEMWKEMKHFG